ncbi:1-deoxy-D-xylulose-5-phosphate synthase [Raoultella planticola]|uniref:1-deoxy-D-xylulose-5-phosphate synthase n=1 Tax=Raoultella planticola TaxID=575 RepID=A0A485C489_RAOPL|nr:1-deoxy-D-xylulose-5-phosphate synthase [Raoultella planticola]
MIKVAPAGQKDAVEMRKIYAGFVSQQVEKGTSIIALEADLMSSMAMDSVARKYPQHVINCGIMEANVIGTAAGLSLTGRQAVCAYLYRLRQPSLFRSAVYVPGLSAQ